ncbi:MAG TPA: apolipoprotein N-acyltransferase [Myxococcales bacterium]|nr:apolipoprotein N-acyltransferase [Myxococcales bacterium]
MKRRLGALAASTALCALYATVRAPWHWLGWVALVPWLLSLDAAARPRDALLDTWLFTASFTVAVFAWFPGAIHGYTGAPAWLCWLMLLLLAPLLEPQFLAFAAARRWGGRAAGVLAYVGVEWAAPKLLADTLGYGLYPAADVRQVAELAGVPGLTLLLLCGNEAAAALARATRARDARRASTAAVALGVLVTLPAVYGHFRRTQLDRERASAPVVAMGLVQTGLTHYDALAAQVGTYEAVVRIVGAHRAISSKLAASQPLDLLVWPETAYPTTYGAPQSEEGAEMDAEIRRLAGQLSTPLLFGTYDAEGGREHNAAVLLSPSGERLGTYRKARLFPFTEYTPRWLEWARGALPWMGTWTPGGGAVVLRLPLRNGGSAAIAPLICYDATDAALVAAARRQGAQALVTISNDGWFAGTRGVELDLAGAAFRSIETRLPQARATPDGLTASISDTGEVLLRAEPSRPSGLIAELSLSPAPLTPAARWGQWLGPVSLAAAAAVLAARALRRQHPRG